jgi:integrase
LQERDNIVGLKWAAGDVGLPLIEGTLGHRQASTTQRYAHLADTHLRAAANVIAGDIAASLFRGA